jgi:hypothetical protein
MRRAGIALAAALVLAGCSTADATTTPADPDFTCSFTHPSRSVASLKRLPGTVKSYIRTTVREIADRGAFFNAGDVVTRPAPFNRFIRGGTLGSGTFLWYEHGGFAYWKQIVLFDRKGKVIAEAHGGGQAGMCAQSDALLDSTRKPAP